MNFGNKQMKSQLKKAFIKTLPVMAGYIVLGIGFGIIAEKSGYGLLWVLAMSTFIYAGSMQYVAVSLLTGGASLITAALTTLMVNARHLFYGISMVDNYKGTGKKKPYLIFALTDETYSLVCSEQNENKSEREAYYLWVSLLNHVYWITGSAIGALIGMGVSFNTAGIDFAMTALFITVFVEQWRGTKNHIPALAGLLASVVCLLIFGKDSFLIPAMICIALALSLGKPLIERREPHGESEA